MKQYLSIIKVTAIIVISLYCMVEAYPQSREENYILTRTYTDYNGTVWQDKIDYFDGLGRPEQSVLRGNTRRNNAPTDLVILQEYDELGRESKQWVSTAFSNNDGKHILANSIKSESVKLHQDSQPYSQVIYEASPLNRILEQYGPGQAWQEHKRSGKNAHLTNITGVDTLNCSYYTATIVSDTIFRIKRVRDFEPGQLYVTRIEDEDGCTSFEFKDKLDRLILTRQIQREGSKKHLYDTYYVYNDFGHLVAVLPPQASDAFKEAAAVELISTTGSALRKYAYLYQYDSRGLCIAKKLPGCDWIFYVYDKGHRLIFTQDGNQRAQKKWSFRIPDIFDRACFSGICQNSINPFSRPLQNILVKGNWTKATNPTKGYTVTGMTLANPVVLSVSYYDNYDFLGLNSVPDSTGSNSPIRYENIPEYGNRYTASTNGLLTGTLTALLDHSGTVSSYLYSVLYYDNLDRLIQSKSSNHLNGMEKEYIAYNFAGQPIRRKHIHSAKNQSVKTEQYTYTYDYAGRLLTTGYQLDNTPPVLLASYEYDELGRLKANKRTGVSTLRTDYTYNIRSWMQNISNTHFRENLTYAYGGNINSQEWIQSGKTRKYTFAYDDLSRLKTAAYTGDGNYNTSYSYDKHGNITSLSRYGNTGTSTHGIVDNLAMTYNGNQLIKVADTGVTPSISTSADFRSGSAASVQYLYDSNGNLKQDLNKGIGNIAYNSLNLPSSFTISNSLGSATNTYVYSADGRKLKVTKGTFTTDYCGNVIYENGNLKRILVDGGYYENGTYYFYLTDHLGNNRVVANQSGNVVQSTQYYPFGMAFADGTNPSSQPYKFGGKELDSDRGLNLYDFHARWQDAALGGRFLSVDPLAEKYYSVSPYVYCMNNPVRFVDPDGRDWYWIDYSDEKKRSLQYDPNITKDSKLGENQKYAGETVQHGTGSYRKDGSIMFSNETDAYNRMWSQANIKKSEQSGYALENGNILVIPDHKNEADDASPSKYEYSVKKGVLLTKDGESFNITGNIHTHQDPTRDATPSSWTGDSWGDVGHSYGMGGLPVIVMGHDGRIHGVFYSVTHKGHRNIPGFGSRNDLLSGKTKLTQWLKTYPTKGE